jgi:GNAT superfamily N-acetyltransferase
MIPVPRIEPLRVLDTAGEGLLRLRAQEHGRDGDSSIRRIKEAVESGRLTAVGLLNDQNVLHGIAAWRWQDRHKTYAQVLLLYAVSSVPATWGALLVEHLFATLESRPGLEVIEIRLRDDTPGVRGTLLQQGAVIFQRCRMARALDSLPLPLLPPPSGYRVLRWGDEHQDGVEALAAQARAGLVDEVVVPDRGRWIETLRRLRAGRFGTWLDAACLVVVDGRERVVGYVAAVAQGEEGTIADVAVQARHRERGLGRLLMTRSMQVCWDQGIKTIHMAVTTRHPVRALCDQLGFQAVECGEVAIWWRDGRQLYWRDGN